MERYSLSHLADRSLLDGLRTLVVRDRATTADLLAHIAEVDYRRLYARAGYPSMRAYCVGELRLSEDAAAKRIQAGRKARRYPAIFACLADGRLHLTAVNLLAPYLTEETVEELLAAATHRSQAEIELLLAERFPVPDPPDSLAAMEHAPAHAGAMEHAVPHVGDRSRLTPLAPGRYFLECTLGQRDRDKLQYALELLSHRNPSGRISALIGPALDALIAELEKEKFAATDRPREAGGTAGGRHIRASVKRAVWRRDGGVCTFVGDTGHACGSRWMVEFDHIHEAARGGEATTDNVRLLCRTHNQHLAENSFGREFMEEKRRAAVQAKADNVKAEKPKADEAARARAEEKARARALVDEVIPYLRKLRYPAEEARARASDACKFLPESSLEERVRSAISGSYTRRPMPSAAP